MRISTRLVICFPFKQNRYVIIYLVCFGCIRRFLELTNHMKIGCHDGSLLFFLACYQAGIHTFVFVNKKDDIRFKVCFLCITRVEGQPTRGQQKSNISTHLLSCWLLVQVQILNAFDHPQPESIMFLVFNISKHTYLYHFDKYQGFDLSPLSFHLHSPKASAQACRRDQGCGAIVVAILLESFIGC